MPVRTRDGVALPPNVGASATLRHPLRTRHALIVCPTCHAPTPADDRCAVCGVALSGTEQDGLLGQVIAGKFRVLSLLGEGATGRVYRAEQVALGSHVAIKVLHPHRHGDRRLVEAFEREARVTSQLVHPNTIQVLDYGTDDQGRMFLAMELVNGESLSSLIAREAPLEIMRLVRIMAQVLGALDEAHASGIVHRDLKPDNIFVENRLHEPDNVKVLDFGVADEGAAPERGAVVGTPEYMSPEQARGEQRLDGRSDLYAVGIILYQAITGSVPFAGESPLAIAARHANEAPEAPSLRSPSHHIDQRLEKLILRCLAKNPDHRPETASELAHLLSELLPEGAVDVTGRIRFHTVPSTPQRDLGPRGKRRRIALAVMLGILVVVTVALAVWIAVRPKSAEPEASVARPETPKTSEVVPDAVSAAPSEAPAPPADEPPAEAPPVDVAMDQSGEPAAEEPAGSEAEGVKDASSPSADADADKEHRRRSRAKTRTERGDSVTNTMLANAEKYLDEGNVSNAKSLVDRVLARDPGNRKAQKLAARIARAK